jgi:hypothetical protein
VIPNRYTKYVALMALEEEKFTFSIHMRDIGDVGLEDTGIFLDDINMVTDVLRILNDKTKYPPGGWIAIGEMYFPVTVVYADGTAAPQEYKPPKSYVMLVKPTHALLPDPPTMPGALMFYNLPDNPSTFYLLSHLSYDPGITVNKRYRKGFRPNFVKDTPSPNSWDKSGVVIHDLILEQDVATIASQQSIDGDRLLAWMNGHYDKMPGKCTYEEVRAKPDSSVSPVVCYMIKDPYKGRIAQVDLHTDVEKIVDDLNKNRPPFPFLPK